MDQKIQNLTSSTSVYLLNDEGKDRLGQVRASNDPSLSSTAFLSSIRGNTSMSVFPSVSSSSVSSGNDNTETNLESSSGFGQRKKTIHDDIRRRLEAIFKEFDTDDRSCSGSHISHGKKHRLTSNYIISRFPDLGDQYAPLFKEILRSVAILRDGQWCRKI